MSSEGGDGGQRSVSNHSPGDGCQFGLYEPGELGAQEFPQRAPCNII